MRIAQVIRRRLRERTGGVDTASDVNVAIAANVGERTATTVASAKSKPARTAKR